MKKNIVLTWTLLIAAILSPKVYAQQNLQNLLNKIKSVPSSNWHINPDSSYSPHLAQLFKFEKKCKSFYPAIHSHHDLKQSESYPDTLIVGVSPYDTLTITGTLIHNGPIFVVLNGLLIIRNANVTNLGDLDVFNNGKVVVDSSTLSFPQSYFYQRSLTLVNKANVSINHSTLSYGGLSHNCIVADTASLSLTNVNQTDWTTTGMSTMGTININGTTEAGEFIIDDYVTLNIKNATNAILWHQFPDTAIINWSFGTHDTAYGYQFNNSKPGVQGIEYNINADSVYDVMWAIMPSSGSNINITNSKIRSIGVWFDKQPSDSVSVSGITDNSIYSSYTAPISDHTLTFTNCTVQTWSFYVFQKSIINVTGCIVGEIGTENSSKMYGTNYVVDGSGGYHWSADTSTIFADGATVYSYVRSEGNSVFVFAYGSVSGSGMASAIDNSLLIVVQSLVPTDPTAINGSTAEFDNINHPGNIFADSIAPINGSAWIHRGPTSSWMYFKNWQLFYRSVDSTTWIPVTGIDTVPVSNSLLANWNTHGLASGDYDLDLRITDTWNNELDAEMQVTLLPLILDAPQLSAFSDIKVYPNPVRNQLTISITSYKNENVKLELDNLLGQNLLSRQSYIATGKNLLSLNTSALSTGTYICRVISAEGISQKLVVVAKQ